jgi:peptidoglycan DL-endopeptidase LytE
VGYKIQNAGGDVGKHLRVMLFIFAVFLCTATFALCDVTYKVKNGDTLQSISKKYKVPVGELKNLNGLTSTKLKVGQTIVVSADSDLSTRQKEKSKGKGNRNQPPVKAAINEVDQDFITYKVAKGDTLQGLAEKFDLEEEEIIDLNGLKKKGLAPGKFLRLPKPEPSDEGEFIALGEPGKGQLAKWRSEEERAMLVKVAKSFTGAPYRFGGDSVRGLDCSAYVKKIYEIFEVDLPRIAREQYNTGVKVSKNDLTTGDLVFFRTRRHLNYPTHVGIYIGDDKFIHASSYLKQGVKINSLSEGYYLQRYTGGVRVKLPPSDFSESLQDSSKEPGNS